MSFIQQFDQRSMMHSSMKATTAQASADSFRKYVSPAVLEALGSILTNKC